MKTKSLIFIALTVFLCTFANAQVRQIFKVIDYSTGKPLAGAALECCGQKLTTNAKGVAVFTSKKHKYGDFMRIEKITLPNHYYVSRDWKSHKSDTFRKDTLVYYMVDSKLYVREEEALFDSLFMFDYNTHAAPKLSEAASMANYGFYSKEELAEYLMSANPLDKVLEMRSGYTRIQPYEMDFIDKEIRKECEELLMRGDIDGCLEKAREQIAENDISEKNLQRISYFLNILFCLKDTTPKSDYYKILYDNGLRAQAYIRDYYFALLAENKTEKAEEFRQSILAKNKDPYLAFALRPNEFDGFDTNPQASFDKMALRLKSAKDIVHQGSVHVANTYARFAQMHLMNGDTLKAECYLDSAFTEQLKDSPDYYPDERSFKAWTLYSLSWLPFENIKGPASDKIYNYRLQLARDIYTADRGSLFGRMAYFYVLQEMVARYDSLQPQFVPTIDSLANSLSDELPYLMLPQVLKSKTLLLAMSIDNQETPGESLQKLANYREAYYKCNKLYPNIFSQRCIAANSYLKLFSYKTENDFLAEAVDAFNEELLANDPDNQGIDSLIVKGNYYNSDAESLYREELYQQSMKSYNKAAGYYTRAAANDTSGFAHILLCNNLLQKGDAYFNLKRYDDAIACYQQVFDYEKQIPQPAKPRYTAQKGQAYHFEGDMMLAQKEFKKANKLFDKAEKEFKKAEKMGDSTLYGHWAELHFSKAVALAQQEKEDKMFVELEIAERLYQTKPMGIASRKYETVKNTLLKRYKENKDWNKYLVCKSTFHQYLDTVKYTDFEHYEEYVNSAIELGDLWANIGVPTAVLRYYKEAKAGKEFLMGYGQDPDDEYYKLAYQVGRYYRICDSTQQAIEQFAECEKINLMMYADTAPETAMFNDLNIKSQTAQSYEDLAQSDTVEGENWYKEAIPLYTLIVNNLSTMDTNPSLKRNLGYYHRRLANVHLNLNHYYSADKHFDTALAVMLPLYNGEFKEYTEEEVARDYLGKAIIYRSNEDYEDFSKAKELLTACIETCQKATDPDELLNIQYYAVSMLLDILEDPTQHASETDIKNYRKQKAELEKKLEKQN